MNVIRIAAAYASSNALAWMAFCDSMKEYQAGNRSWAALVALKSLEYSVGRFDDAYMRALVIVGS